MKKEILKWDSGAALDLFLSYGVCPDDYIGKSKEDIGDILFNEHMKEIHNANENSMPTSI